MTQIEINDNLLRCATRSMTAKITTTGDVDGKEGDKINEEPFIRI